MTDQEANLIMENILANFDERPKAYMISADNIERSRLSTEIEVWKAIEEGCVVIDVVDTNDVFLLPEGDSPEARAIARHVLFTYNFVQFTE